MATPWAIDLGTSNTTVCVDVGRPTTVVAFDFGGGLVGSGSPPLTRAGGGRGGADGRARQAGGGQEAWTRSVRR